MILLPAFRIAWFLALLVPSGISHATASPQVPNVEMRLLDGGVEEEGRRLAGVEIRIDEGWKTYWRHPGDSGLAPRFDFSGSANVADVRVLWPAPSISHNGYGWVFGYKTEVVFPLVVTPKDPAAPVDLVLDLDYAVCAEICVPLKAADALGLGHGGERAIIDHYRDQVPLPLSQATDHGVREIKHVPHGDRPMLELLVDLNGAENPRLVIEGPEAWLFSVPEMTGRNAEGIAIFKSPAADLLPNVVRGAIELTITGMAEGIAFEQRVILP